MNISNCQTKNVVYIILCIKCKIYYIGETSKSLATRIYQHLYKIKNFKPIIDDNVVGLHFRSTQHCIYSDFRVCIFKSNLEDHTERKNTEQDLIRIFKQCFNSNVLNSKISNYLKTKTLSFL